MDDRSNRLLLGMTAIAVALYLIFRGTHFSFTPVLCIALGLIFMLLFWTKQKSWALVVGMFLLVVGLIPLITPMLHDDAAKRLSGAMLWIATGLTFLILYLFRNKRGLLGSSLFFIFFGIYHFLKDTEPMGFTNSALFLVCIGLSMALRYIISRGADGRSPLYIGLLLILFGLSKRGLFIGFDTIFIVILIAAGLILVFGKSRRRL